MSFKGQNLLDIVLFLLLMLSYGKTCTTNLLLGRLNLCEEVLILPTDSFNSMLKALDLLTSIPIVSKDILLLNLEGPRHLLSTPLLVDQLLVLLLKQVVSM